MSSPRTAAAAAVWQEWARDSKIKTALNGAISSNSLFFSLSWELSINSQFLFSPYSCNCTDWKWMKLLFLCSSCYNDGACVFYIFTTLTPHLYWQMYICFNYSGIFAALFQTRNNHHSLRTILYAQIHLFVSFFILCLSFVLHSVVFVFVVLVGGWKKAPMLNWVLIERISPSILPSLQRPHSLTRQERYFHPADKHKIYLSFGDLMQVSGVDKMITTCLHFFYRTSEALQHKIDAFLWFSFRSLTF